MGMSCMIIIRQWGFQRCSFQSRLGNAKAFVAWKRATVWAPRFIICATSFLPSFHIFLLTDCPGASDSTNRFYMNCLRLIPTALALLFAVITATAQDVIVLKDGSTVLSKVTEITKDQVRFKKFKNPDGPTYTYDLSDITAINYENGQKEDLNVTPAVIPQTDIQSTTDRYTTNTSESDLTLLRSYMDVDNQMKTIKKYRIIGWVGGSLLLIAGAACWIHFDYGDGYYEDIQGTYFLAGGAVAATAWTTGWLIAANKKAKAIKPFVCTPVLEHDIWHNSSQRLTASADIINCGINNRPDMGIGVGLRFNF